MKTGIKFLLGKCKPDGEIFGAAAGGGKTLFHCLCKIAISADYNVAEIYGLTFSPIS